MKTTLEQGETGLDAGVVAVIEEESQETGGAADQKVNQAVLDMHERLNSSVPSPFDQLGYTPNESHFRA